MDPTAPQPALPGPAGQQLLDPAGPHPVDCAGRAVLHAVVVELPPLRTDDLDFWFEQAEAKFALRGVTADATKYFYVISALDQATARLVRAFLRAPPAADKYEGLKTFLLRQFSLSEAERATRILRMPGLGDRRPSVLLADMLALLGDHKPCFLFKHAYLLQLPSDLRQQLINDPFTNMQAVGKLADELLLVRQLSFDALKVTPTTIRR
ncbi:uncharacterized protein LOC144597693 [Rhinoraja longicauda]